MDIYFAISFKSKAKISGNIIIYFLMPLIENTLSTNACIVLCSL